MNNIQIAMPALGEEEKAAVMEVLESGWLTQGPKVAAFEKAFAGYHRTKHAIACTSCTTALQLILSALGVGPGDEVIVPAFTWVATANVVTLCGAKPVFVDVDRVTYNMDSQLVAEKITDRTKALMPVHLFGLCADMDAIAATAPHVPLIEDAACAAGATYNGRYAGSLGLAGAFSFHPRKSITTGEGGMVTTNDGQLAEIINMLRNHGASISEEQRHKASRPYYLPEFNLLGFNYRMTDLQGAVGLKQLEKLETFLQEREQWAKYYERELADVEWLRTPITPEGYAHSWQAYVCYVDETRAPISRNEIMDFLQKKGISTRPGTHAVHMLGYYRQRFNIDPEAFPVAKECDQQTMAIPLHNRMKREDYEYVVETIRGLK